METGFERGLFVFVWVAAVFAAWMLWSGKLAL
jgi:hypothetical protein